MKVQREFKVGDVITNGYRKFKIVEVHSDYSVALSDTTTGIRNYKITENDVVYSYQGKLKKYVGDHFSYVRMSSEDTEWCRKGDMLYFCLKLGGYVKNFRTGEVLYQAKSRERFSLIDTEKFQRRNRIVRAYIWIDCE